MMMAKLTSLTKKADLVPRLGVAASFWSRGIGLLNRSSLAEDEGLWIKLTPGNSVHTLFMRFAIDCVFLDSEQKVIHVRENVVPWRLIAPVRGARAVVELPAGAARRLGIQTGEELHVGA